MCLTGCVVSMLPCFTKMLTVFFLLCVILFNCAHGLNLTFQPPELEINVGQTKEVQVYFLGSKHELQEVSFGNWTTIFDPASVLTSTLSNIFCGIEECSANLTVHGEFLGFGRIILAFKEESNTSWTEIEPPLLVTVVRQETILNKLFVAFVATVVSINYINMGCALDLDIVKEVLKKPVGPLVGFVCQSIFMPLVSYGVGLWLFNDPVLRLGLFTFGSSPGGGASNMWTVILGGNLNLSITMTFLSTAAALGTIPLWLFTLGPTIVEGTSIVIPFTNIIYSLISLTVPIGLGICVQKKFPKLAARSKKLLLPICIIILIAIIVTAAIANQYMFYLLTWRMILATCINVWVGFMCGALVSLIFRFPSEDITAISVETGIQNTGVGFLILSYSLKPPVSDIAAVVPVAGSIITPVPLMLFYCFQRIKRCVSKSEDFELQHINPKAKSKVSGIDNETSQNVQKGK